MAIGSPSVAQWADVIRSEGSERDDILDIGGFNDVVFGVVASFLAGDAGRFVAEVGAVEVLEGADDPRRWSEKLGQGRIRLMRQSSHHDAYKRVSGRLRAFGEAIVRSP